MSDYETYQREDAALDREIERREARDRRELAEGQLELTEFRGSRTTHLSGPVSDALNGWLTAMAAKPNHGFGPLTPRSEIVAADPLGTQKRRAA